MKKRKPLKKAVAKSKKKASKIKPRGKAIAKTVVSASVASLFGGIKKITPNPESPLDMPQQPPWLHFT